MSKISCGGFELDESLALDSKNRLGVNWEKLTQNLPWGIPGTDDGVNVQISESFENIQKMLETHDSPPFLVINNTEDEMTDYYYLMGAESTAYTFGSIGVVSGGSMFVLSTITITPNNVVTKYSKEV